MKTVSILFTIFILTLSKTTIKAQDTKDIHKIWILDKGEFIGNIHMVGGIEMFSILDFRKEDILVLSGNHNKIDSLKYEIEEDKIYLKSINNPAPSLTIKIEKLNPKNLTLILILKTKENGEIENGIKLKYKLTR